MAPCPGRPCAPPSAFGKRRLGGLVAVNIADRRAVDATVRGHDTRRALVRSTGRCDHDAGVVFSASLDGHLRGYRRNRRVVLDVAQFERVNRVPASWRSFNGRRHSHRGMLFSSSGYGSLIHGRNLLAFRWTMCVVESGRCRAACGSARLMEAIRAQRRSRRRCSRISGGRARVAGGSAVVQAVEFRSSS
jgi:hypothetical protein